MSVLRREVRIHIEEVLLTGDLQIPDDSCGTVLFVHGSGSSRQSSRNRQVADYLNKHSLATLLVDLLTPEEEQGNRELRFDIGLLADRVDGATQWLDNEDDLGALPFAYFGASTGAAAALASSIRHPASVKAVVSRGGRPDMARNALPSVTAPTLLIVGSLDTVVIDLNEEALRDLRCEKRLEIVEGATHLFEEPGALEVVSQLAAQWITSRMPGICE
jgi:putative phosphoribosyl transferase